MKPAQPTTIFYVYKLVDSLTNTPFYVGKGNGDRMFQHQRDHAKMYKTTTHNNRLLKNKIAKILRLGGKIKHLQYQCKTENQAFDIERALIAKYGRRDIKTGILCNMTNGGEGVSGHVRNEAWKNKQRIAAHARAKAIDQYTITGEFIQTWINYQAIRCSLGIDSSSINRACNGRIKSAGKFRWTWSGIALTEWQPSDNPRKNHKLHAGRCVYQFTLDGIPIATYESLVQAGIAIGKHANTILECCKGRSAHAGGFLWSYASIERPIEYTVYQFNKNGEQLNRYVSVKHAAAETKVASSSICAVLRGKHILAGGFIWSNTNSCDIHPNQTSGKPVLQLTKDTKLVARFPSAKQAIEQTKILGISNCVLGLAKTAGGYIWKYDN